MKKQTIVSIFMGAPLALMAIGCSNDSGYSSYARSSYHSTYPYRVSQYHSNVTPTYGTERASYRQNNNSQESVGSGELKALLALGALLIAPEALLGEGLLEAGVAVEGVEGAGAVETAVGTADDGFLLQQRIQRAAERAAAEKAAQDAMYERAAARQAAPRLY